MGFSGVTTTACKTGAITLRVVVPLIPAALAVTVVAPWLALAATPEFVLSLLNVAVAVAEEVQSTELSCWVLPSLKVPVAVKRCVVPEGIEGAAGPIVILVNPESWPAA